MHPASIRKGMSSRKAAKAWDEAFPSGNGSLGALVMGDPFYETVIFNHEKLFLPLPENCTSEIPEMGEFLPELRKMIKEGKYKAATEFFRNKAIEKGFPEQLIWIDPFHPAFDLHINIPQQWDVDDYLRELDFATGEVTVRWKDERGEFVRRLFVSRADDVAVMSLTAPSEGRLNCILKLDECPGRNLIGDVRIETGDGWMSFHSGYAMEKGGYDGLVYVINKGGFMESSTGQLVIVDAEEVLILTAVVPLEDVNKSDMNSIINRLKSIPGNYEELLKRHVEIHGEMFNRVTLDLGCEEERGLTNEELIERAGIEEVPDAFVERLFNFGRYALISSSGQLPPNLQGVWSGTWSPPWSSGYTLDENVQMMMWQVLPGNLPEAAHSYFKLVESYVEDWKENARRYYGCRGIMSSTHSSRNGLHKHYSVEYPLVFWTAGAGWLAQMFYDYWLFTGDREFLEKRAVPFMKEVALFYEDFLYEDENGIYEFNPSYSPENTPSNSDNSVCINATMDITVARELLTNLVAACRELGIEAGSIPKWEGMLKKLPEYMINQDGALKEWIHPHLEDNYHHRHSSHLYPVFPGFEVTGEEMPELYQACLRAAELRLTDGIEAITGWGLAHLANISARLKDGGLAYAALSRIARKFLLPNLFTCHNEGHLFQLDANMGYTAAVMEMLVFSKPGWLELLPALPQKLARGKVGGLMCRGGIQIEGLKWDMAERVISLSLKSGAAQTITLKLPGELDIHGSETCERLEPAGAGNTFRLALQPGERVGLKLVLR